MMRGRQKKWISISPNVFLYLALLLLVLPLRWILGLVIAATIHELGHLCAVKLLGVSVNRISLEIAGAVIETGPMNPIEELTCVLAGPLAGLIAVFCARTFPELALCAVVQTAYNLIPIYPSDGGRVLKCLLGFLLLQEQVDRIMHVISYLIMASVIVVSLVLFRFAFLRILPLICLVLIAVKSPNKKNSLQR